MHFTRDLGSHVYFRFEEFIDQQVAFLANRGHEPHEYASTTPYQGCAVCRQGPGALQHNTYLIRDYAFLKFMAA